MTELVIEFTLNGAPVAVSADPITRLVNTLRDELRLTGTKIGCSAGHCGACTVALDGKQACACLVPTGQLAGRDVVTVEGLARDGKLERAATGLPRPWRRAMRGLHARHADGRRRSPWLASRTRREADVQDALGGVLCRCTGYRKIIEAVLSVGNATAAPAPAPPPPAAGAAVGARLTEDGRRPEAHRRREVRRRYRAERCAGLARRARAVSPRALHARRSGPPARAISLGW